MQQPREPDKRDRDAATISKIHVEFMICRANLDCQGFDISHRKSHSTPPSTGRGVRGLVLRFWLAHAPRTAWISQALQGPARTSPRFGPSGHGYGAAPPTRWNRRRSGRDQSGRQSVTRDHSSARPRCLPRNPSGAICRPNRGSRGVPEAVDSANAA